MRQRRFLTISPVRRASLRSRQGSVASLVYVMSGNGENAKPRRSGKLRRGICFQTGSDGREEVLRRIYDAACRIPAEAQRTLQASR